MADSIYSGFISRTDEIRSRLIRIIMLVGAIAVIAYIFRDRVLSFITTPLNQGKLIFIHPTEAFFTYIKLSLFVGVLLGAPYILHQVLRFFYPILRDNEHARGEIGSKFLIGFFSFGTLLFYLGSWFALRGVMPFAIKFLTGVSGESLEANFTVGNYGSFIITFVLIFGFLFEMPVISSGLARAGLLRRKTLLSKWRLVIVTAAVLAAILTPPDPITQMFLWGPLLLLYGVSILLVGLIQRQD